MSNKKIKNRNKQLEALTINKVRPYSCDACTSGYCCTNITEVDVMTEEWDVIKKFIDDDILKRARKEMISHIFNGRSTCPFLTEEKRCSIYKYRPFVCATYLALNPIEQCDTIKFPHGKTKILNKAELYMKLVNDRFNVVGDFMTSIGMMQRFKELI